MHMAYNALHMGQCSRAANCGTNIMLLIHTTAAFSKAGMLAADGRCKTLDASADGYVRAEAAGASMLALLPQASLSGGEGGQPAALAILGGSAINQDGRSSSLTAPNGPAQQEVIRAALASAGEAPASAAAPPGVHPLVPGPSTACR
jgi:acyl transferase domain-containing protein